MKISESEARVMEVLWESHPLTSGEVVSRIRAAADWSPKTVRTLLDRLCTKGALARDRDGRLYQYRPLLSREQWLHEQAGALVDTHCRGRLAPLVSAFASRESLSDADREEIIAMLREMSS